MKKLPTLSLPKAPAIAEVEEERAQRFERSEAVDASARKKGSRLKRESLGERVTVYLPPKLADAVRRRCLKERRSISDGMTEAAEAWISASKRGAAANE